MIIGCRCNMTLTPHPDKDELILFGGEYFTGNKVGNSTCGYTVSNEAVKVTILCTCKGQTRPSTVCQHLM